MIKDAKTAGCVTVPGYGMMVEQAVIGDEIWYGGQMGIAEDA